MRIPRIYVDSMINPDKDFFLTGDSLKHVSKVLRLRAGAEVLLFDGERSRSQLPAATIC